MITSVTMKMKTFLYFGVFFVLIFTDICSADLETECSKCPTKEMPMDCADIMRSGFNESGVYTIYPRTRLESCDIVSVFCDMVTEGGGWTIIQRRGQYDNPEDYFVRTWNDYKEGFGDLEKEFWLGNDNIYAITNQAMYALRVDMTEQDGVCSFSRYENFWIENEEAQYQLGASEQSGPAGDAIGDQVGWPFSINDQPNSQTRLGGWWKNTMDTTSINGLNLYGTDKVNSEGGIDWYSSFGGFKSSLKATVMKIRRREFY